MTIEQAVLENLQDLPLDKQQEVLGFDEFLRQKLQTQKPRRNLNGLCADLNNGLTDEDIAEARQEMWGNFPREFPE